MEIDDLINILQRAKRCEKISDNLYRCIHNRIFNEHGLNEEKTMWIDHVKCLIKECIDIIKEGENEGD